MTAVTSSFTPAPLAPLVRYCAAYRLGVISDIIANATSQGGGNTAHPLSTMMGDASRGVMKTADGGGCSPLVLWSRQEKRWCAFLHWATRNALMSSFSSQSSPSLEMTSAADVDIGDITRHILSYLEVTPKTTFELKAKATKRERSPEEEAGDNNEANSASSPSMTDHQHNKNTNTMNNTLIKPQTIRLSRANPKAADDALVPYYFVSPPFTDTVSLFVHMSSQVPLTDEELNHLFGRYGMVSAKRVGKNRNAVEFAEGGVDGGAVESDPMMGSPQMSSGDANGSGLRAANHLHSFIVTLDVNRNCLRAIQEIRHAEIIFIAFSRPERNVYCVADLPSAPSRMRTLLASVIPFKAGTSAFSHIVASLRLAQGISFLDGDGGDGSNRTSMDLSLATAFVPDLIVDHLPFWTTREQLASRFAQHGYVKKLRLSINDRNGSFLGTALVSMGSLQEAINASEALNGHEVYEGWPMTVGVLTEQLEIVSLKTGEILSECEDYNSLKHMRLGRTIMEQRRMWV